MRIKQRNDKNGNPLPKGTILTKENCPELQEVINEIAYNLMAISPKKHTA